jgi:hypothetical protein
MSKLPTYQLGMEVQEYQTGHVKQHGRKPSPRRTKRVPLGKLHYSRIYGKFI